MDEEADWRYGKDRHGDELPEELAFREGRLGKTREATAALEAEAVAAAEQAEAEGREHPGAPEAKAQHNLTDPQSRIMPAADGKDFRQAYNCQAVVDHEHQVIVATRATKVASDQQQAVVMIEEVIANTGEVSKAVSADAGYYSAQAVADLQALGTDLYVAPEKTLHGHQPPPAPRGRIPGSLIQRPDAPQAADRTRPPALRVTHGDGRTGLRSDHARPMVPAVPAAGFGEGQRRMVANLHRPQSPQAIPLRSADGESAITHGLCNLIHTRGNPEPYPFNPSSPILRLAPSQRSVADRRPAGAAVRGRFGSLAGPSGGKGSARSWNCERRPAGPRVRRKDVPRPPGHGQEVQQQDDVQPHRRFPSVGSPRLGCSAPGQDGAWGQGYRQAPMESVSGLSSSRSPVWIP